MYEQLDPDLQRGVYHTYGPLAILRVSTTQSNSRQRYDLDFGSKKFEFDVYLYQSNVIRPMCGSRHAPLSQSKLMLVESYLT